jgi:predicted  nucleic acid-binding Zn-ribbon protein
MLALAAGWALAQAPVEDLGGRQDAVRRSQIEAGAAYRELRQAQYEAKLAEQDFLNLEEAHRAALRRAEDLGRELEAAKRALEAARAKEVQARRRYDEALGGVDKAFQQPPVKGAR